MQRCLGVCVFLLLLTATPSAAVRSSVTVPDWALRIDDRGHFHLDGQHKVAQDIDVSTVKPQSRDETLLEWAARWQLEASSSLYNASHTSVNDTPVFLVVGAKTSVLHGFGNRQAIRQTWASADTKPREVRVVFLGCEPDLSLYSVRKREQLRHAIALEKRIFGDLLTSELSQCQDSFARLADKVRAYMQWAVQAHPTLTYAMVVDDDVYLRLDRLLEILQRDATPSTRFFGGNSASSTYRGLAEPVRDPRHKYHVSSSKYPMDQLPPFLTGCHFLLSQDLVHFISRNADDLSGLDALDDVTIGLWLFALLQVKPTYVDGFQILRSTNSCSDKLVSLADLSTPTIRHVHANVVNQRRLCDGFQHHSWIKQVRSIIVPAINEADESVVMGEVGETPDSGFDWDLRHNATSNRLQIDMRVFTVDLAVSFVYIPSLSTVGVGFCGQANSLLQQKLFLTVGDEWCAFHRHVLHASFNETVRDEPGMRALLHLTRHNMVRSRVEDATRTSEHERAATLQTVFTYVDPLPFVVALSPGAQSLQVLFECMFVALSPAAQVLVIHGDEVADNVSPDVYVVSSKEAKGEPFNQGELQHRAKRLFILESANEPVSEAASDFKYRHNAAILTDPAEPTQDDRHLLISAASRLFSHTTTYSPTHLLQARPTTRNPISNVKKFGFFQSSDTKTQGDSQTLQRLREQLADIMDAGEIRCEDSTQTPPPVFCLDRAVNEMKRFKFAFVQDSPAMVSAFLASIIPVYTGEPSVEIVRLFNRRAFIDCSMVQSHTECGGLVLHVDASPEVQDELRREPAIVDDVEFADTFFWHPDAVGTDSASEAITQRHQRFQRLKALL